MQPSPFRLCLLLTQELCRADPLQTLREALAAGVDLVQVREKDMSPTELYHWGQKVLAIGRQQNVPILINDSVEVALALDADGVHLGQDDFPVDEARRLLGPDKLIGLSTHNLEQVEAAQGSAADYLGFGPVFPSPTKGYSQGLGPNALVAALCVSQLPLLAIGGIHGENAWKIPHSAGVAVSSALCSTKEMAKDCLTIGRFNLY